MPVTRRAHMPESTLSVVYEQKVGAVDRILSLLRRRGYPVGGITLERTHRPELGRMTVSVTQPEALDQMEKHLSKLTDVIAVGGNQENAVRREYALGRIGCSARQRVEVVPILDAFHAHALSFTEGHLVVEATGTGEHLDALFSALAPYGIEDLARTSTIAVSSTPAFAGNHRGTEAQSDNGGVDLG
jgi:acetolactate synthase I/III small subunit